MPKEYFKMSTRSKRELCKLPAAFKSSAFCMFTLLVLGLQLSTPTLAVDHSVFTYKNASISGQLVTSSTLVWETYNPKDLKQLQYAVEAGKYVTEDEHYPMYVCRVIIEGIPTSGHTEKILQAHVCVGSHTKQTKYDKFEVLVNKGHFGKVAWRPWTRLYSNYIGAISIGEETYIARHRMARKPDDGEAHWGADFNFGIFDSVGFGKIKVVEGSREKEYFEGEILSETEPFCYEMKDIKLDSIRMEIKENLTDLASGILSNHGDKYMVVETVLSYYFDYMQYWGTHEGLARGLPTKIYEKDLPAPADINWALKFNQKRYETKMVNTKLWPGTALNVTLRGNYVTLEAPYHAKMYAFYAGSDDSISRKISSEVRKSYLKDVKLEFSPVYWIENGTLVPTTTTSTTSTTSTTTRATTTTGEPTPMHEPPVVTMKNLGKTHSGPDSLEKSLHNSAMSNEIPHETADNLAEKHQNEKPAMAGIAAGSSSAAIRAQLLLIISASSFKWLLSALAH